jgi:hypothetical protein
MKMPYKTNVIVYVVLTILVAAPVFADDARSPIPFGGYQKNGKCGCYGEKAPIKSADEARKVIEGFLVGHDLRIGAMEERPNFFRVQLLDGNGIVRDVIIIHKVNGRVRSTY